MFVRMCVIIIELTETSKGRDEDRHLMRLTFCLNKERRRKAEGV